MSTYRRARSIESDGVMRCCKPFEAQIKPPPKKWKGRNKPAGSVFGPKEVERPRDGSCLIATCGRLPVDGEELCREHLKYFDRACSICGGNATDVAEEVSGRRNICTPCWRKTPEGKADAREMDRLRRSLQCDQSTK